MCLVPINMVDSHIKLSQSTVDTYIQGQLYTDFYKISLTIVMMLLENYCGVSISLMGTRKFYFSVGILALQGQEYPHVLTLIRVK